MAFHDNQDRDKVLTATDIVDVVGEHVALKPKGREFVGLCCFHDDKKPSMFVSPAKQIFKCFACGAGGSVFDFVMRYHKLTFPEAMKYLADRAGIQLTPWKPRSGMGGRGQGAGGSGQEPQGPSLRERLAGCNDQAAGFYQAMLNHPEHGEEARDYIAGRGMTPQIVERFQIGVAPNRWDGLATMVGHKHWDTEAFIAAGLIKPRKRDTAGAGSRDRGSGEQETDQRAAANPAPRTPSPSDCFDMLRHRLIFPICDALGRPVAFGGRRLDDEEEPKYLNSPESPLFNKSATLYGLHLAKKAIIDSQTAVLVEGYTDVVACHQHGAVNVAAALGTSLTAEHARVLRRFCEKVVLVMDGDEAGQRAADRAIEIFLKADLDVFLAVIPGGADPDEYLKAEGLDGWNALIDSAQDALAWQFDQLGQKLGDATTVTGRQRLAEQFARRIVDAGFLRTSPVRRSFVTQRLAELLAMPAQAVAELLASYKPRQARPPREAPGGPGGPGGAGVQQPAPQPENGGDPPHIPQSQGQVHLASGRYRHRLGGVEIAERRLIAVLIADNELFNATLSDGSSVDEAVAPAEFVTPRHRLLYQRLFDALCDGRAVTLAALLTDFSADGAGLELTEALADADAELTRLLGDSPGRAQLHAVLEESAHALFDHHRHRRFQEAKAQLTRPQDFSSPTDADAELEAYAHAQMDADADPYAADHAGEDAYAPGEQGGEAPKPPPAETEATTPTAPTPTPSPADTLAQLQALIEDRKTLQSPKNIARVQTPR